MKKQILVLLIAFLPFSALLHAIHDHRHHAKVVESVPQTDPLLTVGEY